MFEIEKTLLDAPCMSAREFVNAGLVKGGVKAERFSDLKIKWLQQRNPSLVINRASVKGSQFVGLSSLAMQDHFQSITPGYFDVEGARAAPMRRDNLSAKQEQRIGVQAFKKFNEGMNEVCPGQPERAFSLLVRLKAFNERYAEDRKSICMLICDPMIKNLVTRYKQAAHAKSKKAILAMFAPFHPNDVTMAVFEVTKHAARIARMHHRTSRGLDVAKTRVTLHRLSKDTVNHLEHFALRDDVTLRLAASPTNKELMLRVSNRY
jgi:hypothetical protein